MQTLSSTTDSPEAQLARSQAGTGVGASCVIPRVGQKNSVGDIVTLIMSFINIVLVIGLIVRATRRKAALGRWEMCILLGVRSTMCLLTIDLRSIVSFTGGHDHLDARTRRGTSRRLVCDSLWCHCCHLLDYPRERARHY